MASQLQTRVVSQKLTEAASIGTELIDLFRSLNFRGNEQNYYDVRNSLLSFVLQERTGIPITLAVVYKCVLMRVGVDVDIIGLPGHVVLGLPSSALYVDVFDNGRILGVPQMRGIVSRTGVPWDDRFLGPLPAKYVLRRMLNNILNCHQMYYNFTEGLERARALSIAFERLDGTHQDDGVRQLAMQHYSSDAKIAAQFFE